MTKFNKANEDNEKNSWSEIEKDNDTYPARNVTLYGADGLPIPSTGVDFFIEIVKGQVEGATGRVIQGHNGTITSVSAPEDIIGTGGLATFSTTANIDSVSSTSSSDISVELFVRGLDANWNCVEQTVTLDAVDAQTTATLTTPLIRIEFAQVRVPAVGQVANLGDIWFYINGAAVVGGAPSNITDSRLLLESGENQDFSGIFTVPAGYYGLEVHNYISLIGTTRADCELQLKTRNNNLATPLEYVAGKAGIAASGTSIWNFAPILAIVIPPKWDIWQRAFDVSATCGLSYASRIILVEASLVDAALCPDPLG